MYKITSLAAEFWSIQPYVVKKKSFQNNYFFVTVGMEMKHDFKNYLQSRGANFE